MNFLHCFQSEWLKRKGSVASWMVILGGFFIPTIILISNLVKGDKLIPEINSPKFWRIVFSDCWQLMALFLLPMGIILSASLIAQLEYKNNTWKQVHTTPQKLSTIFFAKYTVVLVMMIQFIFLFNVGIFLAGIVPPIILQNLPFPSTPFPFLFFLEKNAGFFIDCLPIIAGQFLLSLKYKNFLVSIGVGLLMLVASMFAVSAKYGFIMPYSYCIFFYFESIRKSAQIPFGINIHMMAIGYFILFSLASYILYVTKKEKG